MFTLDSVFKEAFMSPQVKDTFVSAVSDYA